MAQAMVYDAVDATDEGDPAVPSGGDPSAGALTSSAKRIVLTGLLPHVEPAEDLIGIG